MKPRLKIGELARRTRCSAETIRYYEREGLLAEPTRTAGNFRLYSGADVERVAFIRNCRSLDMTLDEIRHLLRVADTARESPTAAHELLDEHLAQVIDRIEQLQQFERQLKALRRAAGHVRGNHRG